MSTKKCPFCAEEINEEAIKCRFCKEMLNQLPQKNNIKSSQTVSGKLWLWTIVGAVVGYTLGAFVSRLIGMDSEFLPIVGAITASIFAYRSSEKNNHDTFNKSTKPNKTLMQDHSSCYGPIQDETTKYSHCDESGQEQVSKSSDDALSILGRIKASTPLQFRNKLGKSLWVFAAANVGTMLILMLIVSAFDPEAGIETLILLIFMGFAIPLIMLLLSKFIIKWQYKIKIINPQEPENDQERYLVELVTGLAKRAGMSTAPEIGIYPSEEVNAFACGSGMNKSMIAFSSALLSKMNRKHIAGVAAHETAHIVNGDMLTMTLLQGLINTSVIVINFALRQMDWFEAIEKKSKIFSCIVNFIIINILFCIGNLILLWFSRHREFEADETSARLVGTSAMSGALETLMADDYAGTQAKTGTPAAAMMISAPPSWNDFFSTHPSLERRIERLKTLNL